MTAAAIRFLYVETLDWSPLKLHLPPRPAHQRLPQVLSLDDIERLLTCTRNPKHRALLMTTYSAGLRVSEVVHLQVTDIESDPHRMLIRVNQGKGQKDRSLSCPLASAGTARLWRLERPTPWLFPGHAPSTPCPGHSGKIYDRARRRAGIAHGSGIHTLRHCFATHLLDAELIRVPFRPLRTWLAQDHCPLSACQPATTGQHQKHRPPVLSHSHSPSVAECQRPLWGTVSIWTSRPLRSRLRGKSPTFFASTVRAIGTRGLGGTG